jgi:dienelactone hydrolase
VSGQRFDTISERWAALAPHVHRTMPAGQGPFPCALLFHGCGGRRPFLDRYMAAIARAGVAAVAIDSFAPRGWSRARALTTVCSGLELPGWRRAGDVLASVWGVSRLPDIDETRLALAGWSHGGWAIMDLMTMALERPGEVGLDDPDPGLLAGVNTLVLAYPYCGPGALSRIRPWRRAPDVFAFVGEKDRVARPAHCRRALRMAELGGARLETWHPTAATHAFDEDDGGLTPFRFDASLSTQAKDRVSRFLADRLSAPRVD